jgi:hypothetical protein
MNPNLMLIKEKMFACGGDRTRAASLKHKNFTSSLQQKGTFHLSGTERPDLCTAPEMRRCHVFFQIQEERFA